jgi:hypothetical protein
VEDYFIMIMMKGCIIEFHKGGIGCRLIVRSVTQLFICDETVNPYTCDLAKHTPHSYTRPYTAYVLSCTVGLKLQLFGFKITSE